jgi:hypothetical protein
MMTHCCSIGSHLDDCSDRGIDSSVVNPPTGLCRASMKLCCAMSKSAPSCDRNFQARFERKCRGTDNDPIACCEGCRVGKYLAALNHTCHRLTLNVPPSIAQMIAKCCTTAAPQTVRKRVDGITCKRGYRWNRRHGKCEDIDECTVANNGCYERTQRCENLVGGYRCVPNDICREGFEFDGDAVECRQWRPVVVEVDEYEPRLQPPTSCSQGFGFNNESGACVDVNECDEDGGLCDQLCVNTVGSYRCVCRRGYRSVGDRCVDVDECKTGNVCSHFCMNVKGSFKCKCPNGMRIGVDKRSCVGETDLNFLTAFGSLIFFNFVYFKF